MNPHVIQEIREKLPQYLEAHGLPADGSFFQCPSPDHEDQTPSCHVIPEARFLTFCFGCNFTCDLFRIHAWLNPGGAPEFSKEQILELAAMFEIEVKDIEITPEEIERNQRYRAHEDMASILHGYYLANSRCIAHAEADRRGWSEQTQSTFRLGALEQLGTVLATMEQKGYNRPFLSEIGLENYTLFHRDALLFPVQDARGRTCAFASRNLAYQKGTFICPNCREAGVPNRLTRKGSCSRCGRTLQADNKYTNSRSSYIYDKSSILYGLNYARKDILKRRKSGSAEQIKPLYVVEGYTDVVTMRNAGIKNVAALGSTALTRAHADAMYLLGIKQVVLALDGDDAGAIGTTHAKEELHASSKQFEINVVPLPDGQDPDSCIKSGGVSSFLGIPTVSAFAWGLQWNKASNEAEQMEVVNGAVDDILAEPNRVYQYRMQQELVVWSGLPRDTIDKELKRRRTDQQQALRTDIKDMTRILVKDLEGSLWSNKGDPEELLRTFLSKVRRLKGDRQIGNLVDAYGGRVTEVIQTFHTNEEFVGWRLGPDFKIMEATFGGIPKKESVLLITGDPNVGKSNVVRALALAIIEHNGIVEYGSDAPAIVYLAFDDPFDRVICNFIASLSNTPYNMVRSMDWSISRYPELKARFSQATNHLISLGPEHDGRLIVCDQGRSTTVIEYAIKEAQDKTGRPIVVIIDSLYNALDPTADEYSEIAKVGEEVGIILQETQSTAIATAHIRKARGNRARLADIKGNSSLGYKVDGALHIHNTEKVFPHVEQYIGPGELSTWNPLPVVELHVLKNSTGKAQDIAILARLYSDRSTLKEMKAGDVTAWKLWETSGDKEKRKCITWMSDYVTDKSPQKEEDSLLEKDSSFSDVAEPMGVTSL